MRKTKGLPHPAYRVMVAPLFRLSPQEMPQAARLAAVLGGIFQAAVSDISFGIILLLVASGVADSRYGRLIARALGNYDQQRAEIGLHSKIMGIVLALLVRGFELWWQSAVATTPGSDFHTHGVLATAIAVTLFVNDLKSIEEKRIRLGLGKIPVLGTILQLLERMASVLIPTPTLPEVQRRREDDEDK